MVVVVTLAGMVAAPCARAAPGPFDEVEVADDRAPRESATELMAQGEAYRAAGNHVEAARAYAAAFDALAQRARPDADERLAFNLAVDELVLAQEADPENLALLEEEVALIERHEARHGAVSPGLAKELARVTDRLEELQPKEETASAEPTEPAEPDSGAVQTSEPEPDEPIDDEHALAEPPRSRPGLEWAKVGSGTAAFVGGIGLVGVGAWTFGAVDAWHDQQLTALEIDQYPDEDGLREQLDRWHRRERSIAAGLVVGGAALAGVGVGLTSWGAWRLRRQRRAMNTIATGPSPKPYPPEPPSGKPLFWTGLALTGSAVVVRSALVFICRETEGYCNSSDGAGAEVGVPAVAIGAWVGMGLLGGGAARSGTWLAHDDVRLGRTSITPRAWLGWALFGSGMAWWTASRAIAAVVFFRDDFLVYGKNVNVTRSPEWLVAQVGWSTGIPIAATGLALALHSRAYRRGRSGFERYRQPHRPKVAIQPSLSLLPGGGALSLSGCF